MAFSNLSDNEKDAFFSLLDEYFTSRPGLIAGNGSSESPSSAGDQQQSAGSFARNALASNPQAATKLMSVGLGAMASQKPTSNSSRATSMAAGFAHRAVESNPQAAGKLLSAGLRNTGSPKPTSPSPSQQHDTGDAQDEAPVSVRDRIQAASAQFSKPSAPPPRPGPKPAPKAPSGLNTTKTIGDVNISSTKDFFGSLRGSTAAKNAPPPVVATTERAFPAKKNAFAPPPTRRLASDESVPTSSSPASPAPPPPPPPPPPPARHEPEPEGEWAEALYDYDSAEPGDLNIRENERVLVTDRSDDDWWKGEFNGQAGVFPASYVKLL
ncbi:unnamed protein product [Peniophora sp. CBMAI 1063]|nr:unnamed protein product [Peniophora sp. CBMAI 1063]